MLVLRDLQGKYRNFRLGYLWSSLEPLGMTFVLWFVFSLARLPSLDYASTVMWMRQPLVAVPMCLLVVSVFWHFRLGVQVMLEDYLHGSKRVIAMLALNFYTFALAALSLFSVLKVALSAG